MIRLVSLFFLLFVHLLLLVFTRFTLWPEMVVYPYLLNNGFFLYKDIITPYPPLFISLLSIFSRIFGYNPFPYKILTWIIILSIDLLIFYIAKRIFKNKTNGYLGLSFFIITSIPFLVNGLWFDLVQTPLILLALYFLILFFRRGKTKLLFYSLFSLVIALSIKQQALWLFLWFVAAIVFKTRKSIKTAISDLVYVLAPLIFLLLIPLYALWKVQTLQDFYFWVIYFPLSLASKMPGYILFPSGRQLLVIVSLLLFFTATFLKKKFESRLLILTALVMILFTYPRFDFFHLIPTLAVLSLLAKNNISLTLKSKFPVRLIALISLVFLAFFIVRYFSKNVTSQTRFFEKDIIESADLIKNFTLPKDILYIQNGPDQILPLSQRLPSKPWADEFPWYLEIPQMQDRVIEGMDKQNPKFVISRPYDLGEPYQIGVYQPSKIVRYLEENYVQAIQISQELYLKTRK